MGKLYRYSGQDAEHDKDITASHIRDTLIGNTTSHGIPHIAKARGFFKKSYWSVLSVVSLAVMTYNIYYITAYYFGYPVKVTIDLEHKEELAFPAVTLCNMSPLRKSLWEARNTTNTAASRRKRSVSGATTETPVQTTTTSNSDSCSCCCGNTFYYVPPAEQNDTTPSVTSSLSSEPTLVNNSAYDRPALTEDFLESEQLLEELTNIDEEEKSALGFSIEDLILDCQFEGSTCYYSDFETIYNPFHGNCYVFNTGWNNKKVKVSRKSGVRHGLHLILNIDQDDYVDEMGETAGIKLLVHPGDQMPFPEDEGISVSPGKATFIGITRIGMGRMGPPHGICIHAENDNRDINVYEEHYPVNYSTVGCQKTCLQKAMIDECACADPYYPITGQAFTSVVPVCETGNVAQDDCRYEVNELFKNNQLECICHDLCNTVVYDMDISSGQWPSDVQRDTILNRLGAKVQDLFTDPQDPFKYTRNLMKIGLFYKEFNYENIQEAAAYRGGNYASDVGGVLGLWFGLSLLTLFEFIEFFMDLIVYACNRNKNKVKKMAETEEDKKRAGTQSRGSSTGSSAEDDRHYMPNRKPGSASGSRSHVKEGPALVPVLNMPQTLPTTLPGTAPSYRSNDDTPPSYRSQISDSGQSF